MEAATLCDYVVQVEKLTDGPVDVWLDRCWWGKYQGLKGLKPFAAPDEEFPGFSFEQSQLTKPV